MKSFHTYKVAVEHEGLTVEGYLKQILQYSGRRIQKLTRQKGILLNGKAAYLQKKVRAKDTLRILAAGDVSYGVLPEAGAIEILYEDDFLLIVNKPARQLVHPAGRTTGGTLANHLAHALKERGIVSTVRSLHRLDRDTSGCVIFAKDPRSQFILEQQLKAGILKRTYWALVEGTFCPPAGTIDAPIGPHPSSPNRRAVHAGGEKAVTHYRTLRSFPGSSLVEFILDTGRTHQIRVHAAHCGHPVIGDGMYGTRVVWMNRQALHAVSVSFTHLRENREITVHAPLPPDFNQAVDFCVEQSLPSANTASRSCSD